MTYARSTCRSCKAPIVWAVTEKTGKAIPVDAEATPDGNIVLTAGAGSPVAHVLTADDGPVDPEARFRSHFATCPNASTHRKAPR